MSTRQAPPSGPSLDPTGRYRGNNYDPNHLRNKKAQEQQRPRDNGYGRQRHPSTSTSAEQGYQHRNDKYEYSEEESVHYGIIRSPTLATQAPPSVSEAIAAISTLPTPSLTSQSASSTAHSLDTQAQLPFSPVVPASAPAGPVTAAAAAEAAEAGAQEALDSLAKLRQFKAEVEASRHTRGGVTELDPSRLAAMAESFLMSQQQNPALASLQDQQDRREGHGGSAEEDAKLVRELQLREQLKGRHSHRPDEERPCDRERPGMAKPHNGIGERSYHDGRDPRRASAAAAPPGSVVINNDPRFTRREVGNAPRAQSPPRYQSGKYQYPASERYAQQPSDRRRSPEKSALRRYQEDDSRVPPAHPMRRPDSRDDDGRTLADRIFVPRSDRKSRSPVKAFAPPPYYASRARSPPRGPSRDAYARPASPAHYPDPRTPVAAPYPPRAYEETAPRYADRSGQDGRVCAPYPTDRQIVADHYDRRASTVSTSTYARPPEYHDRDRRDPEPPTDPYARAGGNYRQYASNDYSMRPPVAVTAPQTLPIGIDTNNVVETLEALKAQISKLEKLVPATLLGSSSNPGPAYAPVPASPAPPTGPKEYAPWTSREREREAYASVSASAPAAYSRGYGYEVPTHPQPPSGPRDDYGYAEAARARPRSPDRRQHSLPVPTLALDERRSPISPRAHRGPTDRSHYRDFTGHTHGKNKGGNAGGIANVSASGSAADGTANPNWSGRGRGIGRGRGGATRGRGARVEPYAR